MSERPRATRRPLVTTAAGARARTGAPVGVATAAAALLLLAGALAPLGEARAESGPYVGIGLGVSSLQADLPDQSDFVDFDENEFAWKAFAGFNIDVPFVDFAVEAGYVNLGSPSVDVLGSEFAVDSSGWNAFAVGAVDVGPFAVFAKLGAVAWDVDLTADGIDLGSDDGTDLAFGIGARVGIGPVQVRGEAEFFQIDVIDDSYLLSASLVWQF